VTQGEPTDPELHFKDRFLLVAPPLTMLLVVLLLGVYIPAPLRELLQQAALLLEVKP
jgi:hydrogenase-4 component F